MAAPTGPESEDRVLRVIARDVDPLDFYDESCRLIEDAAPEVEISAKLPGHDPVKSNFELPLKAKKTPSGCESPAKLVTVLDTQEYSLSVSMEGRGVASPEEPVYPDTFHVQDFRGETPTLVLFE